jgi:hypothetical protein
MHQKTPPSAPLPQQQQQPGIEDHPSFQNVQTHNELRSYICAVSDRAQGSGLWTEHDTSV